MAIARSNLAIDVIASAHGDGRRSVASPRFRSRKVMMLKLRAAALALSAFLSACAAISAHDAQGTADAYADAINQRDVERMIELTDPEVLKRTSDGDELRVVWPQLFAQGDVHESIKDVSPGFSDANGMHYFVSTERDSIRKDGTGETMKNYYIVTSRDQGHTWKIVDLSCVDERWVKGVAPGWNGYPPLPPQSVTRYHVDTKLLGVPATPAGSQQPDVK
jgi:hypothetical protein